MSSSNKYGGLSKAEYIALYNKWYSKLKKSGFEDIEWYDKKRAKGQNSDFLIDQSSKIRASYRQSIAEHYRLCRNFLTHYKFRDRKEKLIFKLYTDGTTYRSILKILKEKDLRSKRNYYYFTKSGKVGMSLFKLSRSYIPRLIKICHEWNVTNKKGCLHPNNTDVYAEEVLIKERTPYVENDINSDLD